MSNKVYEFKKSLKYGQQKEKEFCEMFPELEAMDGYIADMKIRKNGKTVDLKSDRYDLEKTGNFFIERYSYDKVNGGVWQAAEKGIDYYVYQFPTNGYIFVFDTLQLLDVVQQYEKTFRKIEVKNTHHVTTGYLVPRELLEPIAMTMEDIIWD